jgi:hypothetical protein
LYQKGSLSNFEHAELFFLKVARAGERSRDLFILFIFSFHHFTAEPQRLPKHVELYSWLPLYTAWLKRIYCVAF